MEPPTDLLIFKVAIHANILMAEVADIPAHCDQFDVGLTITAALRQEQDVSCAI